MEKFKVGDKVVCVDNTGADLTIGTTYEVVSPGDIYVGVCDGTGGVEFFFEGRFKLAEDTPALGCSLRVIRDRIHEIDQQVDSLKEERVSLVQKLTDEGLALIAEESPADMTNPDNWQVGDCVKVTGRGNHFPLDEIVRLRRPSGEVSTGAWCCEYLDGHDYWWVNSSALEWHSRPSK